VKKGLLLVLFCVCACSFIVPAFGVNRDLNVSYTDFGLSTLKPDVPTKAKVIKDLLAYPAVQKSLVEAGLPVDGIKAVINNCGMQRNNSHPSWWPDNGVYYQIYLHLPAGEDGNHKMILGTIEYSRTVSGKKVGLWKINTASYLAPGLDMDSIDIISPDNINLSQQAREEERRNR